MKSSIEIEVRRMVNQKLQSPIGTKRWLLRKIVTIDRSNKLKQTRILIAESEPEILLLFKVYLDSLGIESITADNGEKALSTFLQSKEEGKNYDAVVLDTHLKEQEGLEVAKKIRENDNRQRIILVVTKMKEQLPKEKLQSTAIKDSDILVMPFRLSN